MNEFKKNLNIVYVHTWIKNINDIYKDKKYSYICKDIAINSQS